MALAWTLYELAKNPHIQERMRTEVQSTVSSDDDLTWEKLEKMQYMENVIKESLRLHSPAYVTGRVAISDVEIGGYFIPGGTKIYLPIDAIHHSSQYWSNPEIFDPERFDENGGWLFISQGKKSTKKLVAPYEITIQQLLFDWLTL